RLSQRSRSSKSCAKKANKGDVARHEALRPCDYLSGFEPSPEVRILAGCVSAWPPGLGGTGDSAGDLRAGATELVEEPCPSPGCAFGSSAGLPEPGLAAGS